MTRPRSLDHGKPFGWFGDIGGVDAHPRIGIARLTPTAPCGNKHLLFPHKASDTSHSTSGPFVGLSATSPKPELAAVVGAHLIGSETHQHDAPAESPRLLNPSVELPTHPFDDCGNAEPIGSIPQMLAAFAVLGFGHHRQTRADPAVGHQQIVELPCELLGGKHQRIEEMHRIFECLGHKELRRRGHRIDGTIVAAVGNAMRKHPWTTEPRQHIGRR